MSDGCHPSEQSEPSTFAPTIRLTTALPSNAGSLRGRGEYGGQNVQTDEAENYATHTAEPRFAPGLEGRDSSNLGCHTGRARRHGRRCNRSRRTRSPRAHIAFDPAPARRVPVGSGACGSRQARGRCAGVHESDERKAPKFRAADPNRRRHGRGDVARRSLRPPRPRARYGMMRVGVILAVGRSPCSSTSSSTRSALVGKTCAMRRASRLTLASLASGPEIISTAASTTRRSSSSAGRC